MAADEGFVDEYYCYTHTGTEIVRDFSCYSRDCDGSTVTHFSENCPLDNLNAIQSCLPVHEGMAFPKWQPE